MDAIKMIKERRSIRNFTDEKIDENLLKEVVEIARYAPSWANYQIARYTFVQDEAIIKKIASDGVNDFVYNVGTLKNAKNVLVLSFEKGKSGKIQNLDTGDGEFNYDGNSNVWEVFDAGIACQTFALAAHAKGLGSVIMGVINNVAISSLIGLPATETVAALLVIGHPEGEHPAPSPRKAPEEIMRII